MPDLKYEIKQKIACLSEGKGGWIKEINLVSWNGNEAKYDIRAWSPDHTKMGKGVTLSKDEMELSRKVQSVNPQIFKNRPLRFSEPEVVTPILQPVSHRRRRLGFDGLSEKCYHCRTGG